MRGVTLVHDHDDTCEHREGTEDDQLATNRFGMSLLRAIHARREATFLDEND